MASSSGTRSRRSASRAGLVYLPHPFDRMHAIPDAATLHRHLAEIDVFEVYNARLLFEQYNDEALRFARKYNLTMGAGLGRARAPGARDRRPADARVPRSGGVPRQPAHGRGAPPPTVARLPPGAQVDGAGQGKSPLGEKARRAALEPSHGRNPRALPPEGDHRDQRARGRDHAVRREPCTGARLRASARRHHAAQVPAPAVGDPGRASPSTAVRARRS